MASDETAKEVPAVLRRPKLHGRAFYESIGSPKYIVAPMVNQSEFAWRMLSRSFMTESEKPSLLAYSPMFHSKLFADHPKYRMQQFQPTKPGSDVPFLDGNPAIDRPLFVQFCANDPQLLLNAARHAAPYCDAVDLNLGCPQGIAKAGHYGSFLQEDQELIYKLINTLHENLDIPVTAKIRILDTKEATLKYAQNVLSAGASILTVHGRRREQKGHLTGLADWEMIRYLRDNLPPETVLFANGNILQHGDLEKCLAATGADGVMSAEGNLSNPAIFAPPPPADQKVRGYWHGKDGRGGWRVDEVFRRYLDILHQYVLGVPPPARRPLFEPGDDTAWMDEEIVLPGMRSQGGGGKAGKPKKRKNELARENPALHSTNFAAMQPHLFHLLRHFVARHHDVRDALASVRTGDMETYEAICRLVEKKVAEGLLDYERTDGKSVEEDTLAAEAGKEEPEDDPESSARAIRECKRPWWVVQPIIRPLPKEAMAKGAVQPSKKEKKRMAAEMEVGKAEDKDVKRSRDGVANDKPAATGELEKTTSYPPSQLVSG
ncbi:tRNA dihydrouridine synthase [Madurella fahalii]|uniref:tRNA-dihydrouridine(16/17) synthase [NAD(P)(+)] n=1 Tax=Madurella fahalii TaxID=1157608 RepID=A0ABQ0GSB3_9PEZI